MIFTPRLSNSGLILRHVAEFGRADRREILGVREQHRPGIADPVVKMDWPSVVSLRNQGRCR